MKMWERVRAEMKTCKQQYGFMPRKSAVFALRLQMEKYREDQRELRCGFVEPWETILRQELWYCVRRSREDLRVVQECVGEL